MPFAPVEGGQLHYRLDGKQDLPTLVLSNALGTDLSMWDPQVPAFTEHFRVLRYDSFGHGASTFSVRENTMDRLGKDVVDLLDHLGIANFSFCGLSVGGLVGQWLALHVGERLAKLVLSNTAAHIGTVESWKARIETVRQSGMSSVSQATLDRWFTASFHNHEPGTVDRIRKMIEATPPEGYIATCVAIRDADFRRELSRIRTKTLIIASTHDKSVTPEDGRYLAVQIPNARYLELDAAHLSNVELPQRFSEAVLKFLVQ